MSKKLFFFWLPPIALMALIFFASSFHSLRASPVAWQDFLARKTIHFLEYAVLFLLFFRAFRNTTKLSFFRAAFLSFVSTILYALSDEFHQTFVAGRTGLPRDVLIDGVGAASSWLVIWKNEKIRHMLGNGL
ncbi:VanZ family protein [Candidatus Shapirobacteria bacterium]|nr:VanZ family protein [Candidatus Shapirobacteria bacterium]